jgi:hypothetical protein
VGVGVGVGGGVGDGVCPLALVKASESVVATVMASGPPALVKASA